MKLLDHHMHTEVSHDSIEKMENYLLETDGIIITTEHLDFNDPSKGYQDLIPNYSDQLKEVNRLNDKYGHRAYMGIEIGWTKDSHNRIIEFIKEKDYDLKLLSLHQNGKADFMERNKFINVSPKDIVEEYFKLLKEAVEAMSDVVDVMAHFDYGFRVHNISVDDVEKYGRSLFENFCKVIIQNRICFELNTSSMYRHNNLDLYKWAVPIYQSLGGTLFTLGSDAHRSTDYKYHFEDAIQFLKDNNITHVQHLYGPKKGDFKII